MKQQVFLNQILSELPGAGSLHTHTHPPHTPTQPIFMDTNHQTRNVLSTRLYQGVIIFIAFFNLGHIGASQMNQTVEIKKKNLKGKLHRVYRNKRMLSAQEKE